ncbi:MAG: hypothetical protein ACLPSH_09770 [Vulcanimicrobiaceae bacterium]
MANERNPRRQSDETSELHTQADDERPLTRREAEVAGITPETEGVYGDDSFSPNDEDKRDSERAGPGEHL